MRRRVTGIIVLFTALLCNANNLQQQYEKAYFLETAKGQTEEALKIYRKIAATEATDENRETILLALSKLQQYYGFPHVLPFQIGLKEFENGDTIEILDIRGTKETFELGETYTVRGTYTLQSHDEATLAYFISTRENVTTRIGPSQRIKIEKGTGTFELRNTFQAAGWPHISFYPAPNTPNGSSFGGVYFGSGEWLRIKPFGWQSNKDLKPTGFAWQQTTPYRAPDFEAFFPDNAKGGRALDKLWESEDKDERPDKEILATVRNGLRRTKQHRTSILRWIGNKYIWGKSPQHPYAIEIMYHAADFSGERADPYGTRHYAVYFGLSVTQPKTPAILRTLAELCMRVDDPNDLSRVAWGAKSQQTELLKYLAPYLDSEEEDVRTKAKICKQIFTGKLKAFGGEKQQAEQSYSNQLPAINNALLKREISELKTSLAPVIANAKIEQQVEEQRKLAKARMRKDLEIYSNEELRNIENLYQVANKKWRTQEGKKSLEQLVSKYGKANRTGCAYLYLGQMSTGEEREKHLKRAIKDFSDCYYGDGVQVGAYARYHLAYHYKSNGKTEKAKTLFNEIREQYPNAINHKGRPLASHLGNGDWSYEKPFNPHKTLQTIVDRFDMKRSSLDEVVRTFGEPEGYFFKNTSYKKRNLPTVYNMVYPSGFNIFMKDGKIKEFRFEEKPIYEIGGITVGSRLGEVVDVLGKPTDVVAGEKCTYEDGILYRNSEGFPDGHAYYSGKGLRLFFMNDKVIALYVTDNTILRDK